MKSLVTILVFPVFFAFSLAAKSQPFSWKVQSTQVNDTTFHIKAECILEAGWYLYAQDDAELQLEKPSIVFDNENLLPVGQLLSDVSPGIIQDKVLVKRLKVYKGSFSFLQVIKVVGDMPAVLPVKISGFASNGVEFLPIEVDQLVKLEGGLVASSKIHLPAVDLKNPASTCGQSQQEEDSNLLSLFLLGFGGGLLALLTPCIFPLIPVTVSYFTGKAKTKKQGIINATLYGACILGIYALASVPFHFIKNIDSQVLNTISTNAWVNIFFFVVFILFALAFFGLFNITLPNRLQNIAGTRTGIFFLALTLVIVSFSCTGVILGSLLVTALSANGTAWQLTSGMAGFGAALALPFALFAMFPQWLNKLPKSGGWMHTLKVSLAFIELALAIKFLSNADLVEHWGFIKREVFIALWAVIAFALSLYLFGVFNKSLNAGNKFVKSFFKQLSLVRITFAFATLLFTAYLVRGLVSPAHANLHLLSGFAPPLSYSIHGTDNVQGKGLEPDVINDYDIAIALAKKHNKPLLIDFTGWACVNCRKMEEQVWTQPQVSSLIKENFILLSLYVDDRKKLPSSERITYTDTPKGIDKEIITIGDKYATMQAVNFNQVTQPLYVILSPGETLLNNPVGYTPAVDEYKAWLQCGLNAHNANK